MSDVTTSPSIGRAWLVGAGPGDPGLLTLAGRDAIAGADVILYDALVAPAILRHAQPGAERIYVGKRAGAHALSQDVIEQLIVEHALAGKRVCRLKGGDPFVFGRGGEEALACRRAGVPFVIVPGISSALAGPAYAGIPVTHRRVAERFTVMTGREAGEEDSGDEPRDPAAETLVILMGMSTLTESLEQLVVDGRDPATPAAAVRWGTRTDQQVVRATLGTLAERAREAGLGSPAAIVVGNVVSLAEDLAWFTPGPLAGQSIVVTRSRAQAGTLSVSLEALGAHVVEAPVIRLKHRGGDVLPEGRWDWIVFTSANGVEAFFAALSDAGRDARSLAGTRIAAVGDATATALSARAVRPDFLPSRATGACLGAELPVADGERVLFPASMLADEGLAEALRARGASVEQAAFYDNVPEPLDAEALRETLEADAITFTSASTAQYLRQALGGAEISPATKLISIGPKTTEAVLAAFGRVDAEAAEPNLDALVAATREALS